MSEHLTPKEWAIEVLVAIRGEMWDTTPHGHDASTHYEMVQAVAGVVERAIEQDRTGGVAFGQLGSDNMRGGIVDVTLTRDSPQN